MLRARKANRVLRIPDERAKDYVALGYTIESMEGTILNQPEDPKALIVELRTELAKKDERISYLEKKLGIDSEEDHASKAPDGTEAGDKASEKKSAKKAK